MRDVASRTRRARGPRPRRRYTFLRRRPANRAIPVLDRSVVLPQHRLIGFRGRYCILRAYSSQTGLSSFMNRMNRADPRMGSKHESRVKAG